MLPRSTLNSHLFAKGRTRRGGSRRSVTEGGTLNYQLALTSLSDLRKRWERDPLRKYPPFQKILARLGAEDDS